MIIGVPKEIKNHEYRVGLTPAAVKELTASGHDLLIENEAGKAIGFGNDQYLIAGAKIVSSAVEVFEKAQLVVKVKEPQLNECKMLREGQTLFTYLHLAPDPKQTEALIASGATCIAYETVTDEFGGLPLLAPMSEVAGRLSIQAAAHHLENPQGGSGILLGGVPGVTSGKVMILGGGVVGTNAAKMAIGLGADVVMIDRSIKRLRELDDLFGSLVKTEYSTADAIEKYSAWCDVIIGGVLIPGASAPKLIQREHLTNIKDGSVIVDVAIDQGGCFETSKATTHEQPTFIVDGVIHYCVANMPGAVARTSTMALNNATLRFVLAIANKGVEQALLSDEHLMNGLNVHRGRVTYKAVAEALGYEYIESKSALKPHR